MIAMAFVSLILIYFIVSIVRQQRRYRKLVKAKINAEISTLENERKRISGDLHDEVGPLLSAIKLQINHLEAADPQQQKLIGKSSQYIDDVIKRMREISNDLLPSILVRRGLGFAIEDFLEKLRPGTQMQIETDIQLDDRLESRLEINLYRMVQEIAHNTIKHANASKFRIEISQNNQTIRLATADNGVGIPADVHKRKEAGLGLLTLQSRAEILGGEMHLQSSPGKGTRFLFEIPINE